MECGIFRFIFKNLFYGRVEIVKMLFILYGYDLQSEIFWKINRITLSLFEVSLDDLLDELVEMV